VFDHPFRRPLRIRTFGLGLWDAFLLEAVPVLGTFIPGSTIILSLSALIATGDLNPVVVFCSVIGGAALGDGSAFWLGYRYPSQARRIWPLNKYQVLVYRGEMFFQKYGKAAVLLARFLPPVRAFVPITAGAMGRAAKRATNTRNGSLPKPTSKASRAARP
jgi:membrane protein DedA with SNARE-associated domain